MGKFGRIVMPKSLRDCLRLTAGDTLEIDLDEDRITLRPVRAKAYVIKKSGIWVYAGELPKESIPQLIDRERKVRDRQVRESAKSDLRFVASLRTA